MSKIRFRQKQLILAGSIGGIVVLLICVTIGYFYFKHIEGKNETERNILEEQRDFAQMQLEEETIAVEVAADDYEAGDILHESDLVTINVPKRAVPENVMHANDIVGKYTKINLKKNTPITDSMLYEDGITPDDLRNQEFRLIELPSKLEKDEFVDVRVKFPTGQDYIVLSKKKVKDLANGTIWYEMDEQEILTMSSAIVDAYINDATIYALTYVDPHMQNEAAITYPANEKVLDLIDSDPNIIDVATTELERRYRQKLESDLQSMTEKQRQDYSNGKNGTKKETEEAADTSTVTGNSLLDQQQTPQNSEAVFTDNNVSVPVDATVTE
ncbi:SAF domain-containing protein [Paenibacillus sp. PDC88]|uniref:SAF domain-containing protein n=1 Tax=Paenibacillus provencensis TaxID=441151 RepID=A0ABW3PVV1_9BACL|nr:SAF domain-containing protein [Paenibacillus sp. PDC88]SDX62426.1 Chaperone for flagella basal body P-ring formation [Paenibacillus sp. PDC88]